MRLFAPPARECQPLLTAGSVSEHSRIPKTILTEALEKFCRLMPEESGLLMLKGQAIGKTVRMLEE